MNVCYVITFICKSIYRRAITSKLKREACLLYDLRHPNIIQFTGVLWTPPEFGLAMPLVAHGSLDKFIEEYETGPLVKVCGWILLKVLCHL
jgi:serine/threonine protein kinase